MNHIYVLFCLLAMACTARAQSPALSISLLPPATAWLSWPSNFTDWQLTSATNVSSPANWQPVPQTPIPLGSALVVLFPIDEQGRLFRLEHRGSCMFHATPPVIASGGTSTLSWCLETGTTYRLSPGPGIVTGGSFIVSPAVTTVYTLIASNASGAIPSVATVTVSACGFANVTNWDGTLNFSYAVAPSSAEYNFSVNHQAQLSFHLTRSMVSATSAEFTGYPTGNASMNDRVDDLINITTLTTIGSGPPLPDVDLPAVSQLILDIDCTSGTYSFTIVLQISATLTASGAGPVTESSTVGTVLVGQRALPGAVGTLSSSELLPARGPLWFGGGDLYKPGDLIADSMFITGVVTDTTAGSASVNWSFAPAP